VLTPSTPLRPFDVDPLGNKAYRVPLNPGEALDDVAKRFKFKNDNKNLDYFMFEDNGFVYIVVYSKDITPNGSPSGGTLEFEPLIVPADSGAWSGVWGDPHIATPDRNRYSFQAAGDYILSIASDTEDYDDFQIQVRYTPFTDNGRQWSGESALAMIVNGDKVELYAQPNRHLDILVNEEAVSFETLKSLQLPNGGTLLKSETAVIVSWPDGTLLSASLTFPDPTRAVRGFTRIYFPSFRSGKVSGLMGNFDSNPYNDFQLNDGTVLNSSSESQLYVGGYRDSWSVLRGGYESLFSQGSDPYNASYPNQLIQLEDLLPSQVEAARQQCESRELTGFFLKTCIVDTVVTANPAWIDAVAEAATALDPTKPSIVINPPAIFMTTNQSRTIEAIVRGTSDSLVWTATGGSISSDSYQASYTAPTTPGTYTLTARLASDANISSTATIYVVREPSIERISNVNGYTFQYTTTPTISPNGKVMAYVLNSDLTYAKFRSIQIKNFVTGEEHTITNSHNNVNSPVEIPPI
jgi:von Willebrand factor type D domain